MTKMRRGLHNLTIRRVNGARGAPHTHTSPVTHEMGPSSTKPSAVAL